MRVCVCVWQAFTTAHGKLAGKTQNAVTALTTLALPFQPMVVAGIHTVATEVRLFVCL